MKKIKFFLGFFLCATIFLFSFQQVQQEDISETLKSCGQAVASIVTYDSHNKELMQGKGLILSADGLLLTNYHLVCQAHSAKVLLTEENIIKKVDWDDVFYPGYEGAGAPQKKEARKTKGKWIRVRGIISVDKSLDLVLLKIDCKDCTFASLVSSDELGIGNKGYIVVNNEALSEASITSLKNIMDGKKVAKLNLSFPEHMSGSPLFNDQGKAFGIVTCLGENLTMAIPAAYAQHLITKVELTPLSKLSHENFLTECEGLYLKGIAHITNENYENALQCMETALQIDASNPHVFAQIGYLNTQLKHYDQAIPAYQKAVQMNPNDYLSSYGLGLAYLRLNQPGEAISPLLKCTQANPNFPDAFNKLGFAYETAGEFDKAAIAYQRFVEINPGPAWTGLNQLGSVYVKLGHYDKAIEAFQKVIVTNPSDLKANYNLAYSYDMTDQHEQAVVFYRKLIQLNPNDAQVYFNLLFRVYHKAGDYTNAVAVCQEIIQQFPDNPQNHYNLGITYFKIADYDKALKAFLQAISLKPDFDIAYYNIGLVYFRQKKFPDAIQAFTKFVELKPDNADAYYNIGAAFLQMKKYEDALAPLQKAVELKPDYDYAHYNLGLVYFVLGDRFSANQEYRTLQKLNRDLAEKLYKIIHK
ncbi:MAG: tetratricopeptide repeat protein [Candidatus Aminicenantes bacterium]|nr:tetratricopeptide repeat protein [Candidatus Aminicenantes bacterium]